MCELCSWFWFGGDGHQLHPVVPPKSFDQCPDAPDCVLFAGIVGGGEFHADFHFPGKQYAVAKHCTAHLRVCAVMQCMTHCTAICSNMQLFIVSEIARQLGFWLPVF